MGGWGKILQLYLPGGSGEPRSVACSCVGAAEQRLKPEQLAKGAAADRTRIALDSCYLFSLAQTIKAEARTATEEGCS